MPDQNWDKLKKIFHAAVALPAAERAAYVNKVCDGNEPLREAVESLIKSHEETGNFVDAPAHEAAIEMLADGLEDRTGQTIAHYTIRSLLGAGGMGQVYLAEDIKLKRKVALKVLPFITATDQAARNRLLREARSAAALDHPNICGIHEVGEIEGTSYIAMQYIDGETLDLRLESGPFSCNEALTIASQIAEGLTEAHSFRIVHRDIKPANIILNNRNQVKILDFGLAKLARESLSVHSEVETEQLLSAPGTVIGTVPYMSPEQVKGESLDERSDIFSFGVVLFEMLTGHKLFAASNAVATISAILAKEPEPLERYGATCPKDVDRILQKCLAKDRERRYQSMREVATDLQIVQRALASGSAAVFPSGDRPTEKIKVAPTTENAKLSTFLGLKLGWVLAAAAVLVTVALVYALFTSPRSEPPDRVASMNSAAYDYYLRGKLNASSENRDNNETAIKVLEDVVKMEPSFAPAYAELARAYGIKASFFAPDAEKKKLIEAAKLAVEKSLALDPNLAEGHFVRGGLLWTTANRFPHEQAIQSLKKAIVLDPALGQAHHQLGVIYFHIGLLDKGEEEIKKALTINPSDTLARFRLGSIEVCRGKYEEALAVLKTVPQEENPAIVDRATAISLFQLGRTQEAAAIVENYLQTYPSDEGGNVTSVKAILLAKEGKVRDTEETIQRAIELGKNFQHFHHTTYNIASAYALMNKVDEALRWLQFTADEGFPCYPLFENDASLNSLRKDKRFIAFMTKLKQQWERYNTTL